MKGLILAAGRGTRLRPLTDTRPKPLVPIAGRPILEYNIVNLREAGIRDIVVVINADAPQIPEHFGDGSALGVRLTYVPQPELLGTGHAVAIARDALGNDPFVLVFGDNMTGYRLSRLVQDYQRHGGGGLLAVSEGGDPRKHAVVTVEGERVVRIEERPGVATSPYTSAGMYAFDSRIFDALERIEPVSNGEYYLPHAVQVLVDAGHPVYCTVADGWRVNINSPADLLHALQFVLRDQARAEEDLPEFSPGVGVGDGVRLRGAVSFGHYTYIGNHCDIGHNTCIVNSMLMDHVRIGEDCRIANAILGVGAVVPSGTRTAGNGAPLVVPDHHILDLEGLTAA